MTRSASERALLSVLLARSFSLKVQLLSKLSKSSPQSSPIIEITESSPLPLEFPHFPTHLPHVSPRYSSKKTYSRTLSPECATYAYQVLTALDSPLYLEHLNILSEHVNSI